MARHQFNSVPPCLPNHVVLHDRVAIPTPPVRVDGVLAEVTLRFRSVCVQCASGRDYRSDSGPHARH